MDVEIVKQSLTSPEDFSFPFKPYSIQQDFMKTLYTLFETSNLGIFESPTGTGKSLSIICGALRWLKDHEKRERSELQATINVLNKEMNTTSSSEDWLNSQAKQIEVMRKLRYVQSELDKIIKYDEKIKKIKDKIKEKHNLKWINKVNEQSNLDKITEQNGENDDDSDFLLENNVDEFDSYEEAEEQVEYEGTKIYICSRTHSQLAQLIQELKKTVLAEDIRVITLASRQNYCINSTVKQLNNNTLINERCLDLQKNISKVTSYDSEGKSIKKKRKNSKCPYMQNQMIENLSDLALLNTQDVEDLVKNGHKVKACPYYAARSAVKDAQIILLPYNLILHKSTREASGIKLKNNIVIIDEAHNLIEALADMYSSYITGCQLTYAHNQLTEYRNRYRTRFNAQNLLNINQLLFIIGKFIKLLGGKPEHQKCIIKENITKLYSCEDFITECDIGHLNLYNLLRFCTNSKICHKLQGFSSKFQISVNINEIKLETGVKAFLKEISDKKKPTETITTERRNNDNIDNVPKNPMLALLSFLECLTNKYDNSRILCIKQTIVGKSALRYMLLDPSVHFKDIVSDTRAVLVAGGTMQPMSEFSDRLFTPCGARKEKIIEFSCDHIVPSESVLPIILANGPTGYHLDFSFTSRNLPDTLNELGSILMNICSIIPSGVVCFLPSYDYENVVFNHLEKTNVLQKLSLKKEIFREPKLSSDVDEILSSYARAIKYKSNNRTGALLFSVVGGKLSEGLNFSDGLGRCVIVVGMPYPNIKSLELQEKMTYLDKNVGAGSGNDYYESMCMKAVNQCIGRAIRHINDYACILLLDRRYNRIKTQRALPKWIQRSLVNSPKFGLAFANISKFFSSKK